MWGDHLIPPPVRRAKTSTASTARSTARARPDSEKKRHHGPNWHYFSTENYRSTSFFLAQGHDVWCGVWFDEDGIRKFAQHAMLAHAPGMIYTTWCRPDLTSIPRRRHALRGAVLSGHGFDPTGRTRRERIVTASAQIVAREWAEVECRNKDR